MARKSPQPKATSAEVLECVQQNCPSCGKPMWNEYNNLRRVRTIKGVVQLLLKIHRCQNITGERYRIKYRPEQEGSWALPQQEFGLNVIALVGALRYQEQRSIAQIHQQLRNRGVEVSERSVTHLLERYDELVALWLSDHSRLKAIAKKQGRLILAIDGMQPDVGHEVLWVIRDCLSGEILLAKTLLVIRGTVQLASAIATALHSFTAQDLSQVCVQTWQQLRSDLCQHQLNRIEQLRFRRNPEAYLATLEQLLL